MLIKGKGKRQSMATVNIQSMLNPTPNTVVSGRGYCLEEIPTGPGSYSMEVRYPILKKFND